MKCKATTSRQTELTGDPGYGPSLNTSSNIQRSVCAEKVSQEIELLSTKLLDPSHQWQSTRATGQELEFVIIDRNSMRPVMASLQMLPKLEAEFGSTFGSELLQSNVEMSTRPLKLGKGALYSGEVEIVTAWKRAADIAAQSGHFLFAGGMLPLYTIEDFQNTSLLYPERYEKMNEILMSRLSGSFTLSFANNGEPLTFDNFSVEGAPTSHQVHLSADPQSLVKLYNASLAVMGPLIALSANSPFFCGRTGWHESRIPLLEQGAAGERFVFSSGFAHTPADLFADLNQYPPLTFIENGEEVLLGKKKDLNCDPSHLPSFQAHNGTVWKWLRPCYFSDGITAPHVRIEQRMLPAGPTPIDMAANAAFLLGAVHGMVEVGIDAAEHFRFDHLRSNFYAGAEHGLSAPMRWTSDRSLTAQEIIRELIPLARLGLQSVDVSRDEIDRYLDVIRERNDSARTPARWMLSSVAQLERDGSTREEALTHVTRAMVDAQQRNLNGEVYPIHQWPILSGKSADSLAPIAGGRKMEDGADTDVIPATKRTQMSSYEVEL